MNLNEINFSFGGLHCLRDFGAIYVEKGGHIITPPIVRDEYEIAGVPGTIDLGASLPGILQFSGSLYFTKDPPSQAAAQVHLRRIAAWLTDGRQRLIFDYEPLRYYMASVNNATQWVYSGWIDGGLDIAFTAQPYAYAVNATSATVAAAGTAATLSLTLDTGKPAPISVTVRNTGTAPITGVTITKAGKKVLFDGMNLIQNTTLSIDMEPPIGAAFSDGKNTLPYARQFDILTAQKGTQTLSVALTYGSGTKTAAITATAQGRWI